VSNTLYATIAIDALTMAMKRRSPLVGLVHRSDRGVQSACHVCRGLLEEHGIGQSMSRAGNCYDNAMMERL
jgi:transposase InsO family protein